MYQPPPCKMAFVDPAKFSVRDDNGSPKQSALPALPEVPPCGSFQQHCVCPVGVCCPFPHVPPQRPYPESFVRGALARGDWGLYGIDPPPAPAVEAPAPSSCDCGDRTCNTRTPPTGPGCACGSCEFYNAPPPPPPLPLCDCDVWNWDCRECNPPSPPPSPPASRHHCGKRNCWLCPPHPRGPCDSWSTCEICLPHSTPCGARVCEICSARMRRM